MVLCDVATMSTSSFRIIYKNRLREGTAVARSEIQAQMREPMAVVVNPTWQIALTTRSHVQHLETNLTCNYMYHYNTKLEGSRYWYIH